MPLQTPAPTSPGPTGRRGQSGSYFEYRGVVDGIPALAPRPAGASLRKEADPIRSAGAHRAKKHGFTGPFPKTRHLAPGFLCLPSCGLGLNVSDRRQVPGFTPIISPSATSAPRFSPWLVPTTTLRACAAALAHGLDHVIDVSQIWRQATQADPAAIAALSIPPAAVPIALTTAPVRRRIPRARHVPDPAPTPPQPLLQLAWNF